MDVDTAQLFAKALTLLPMITTPIAEAWLIKGAFDAIGRNPKLEETLFSKVIISVALVETTAIYSLVAFFLI
jgi:F0F1-type ATP synthase membrane subunit c/vacuolar-type H+-ATPase subunit K